MKRDLALFTTAALFVASVAGCANSPAKDDQANIGIEYRACTEPRPEICTMQYDPVCGQMADGHRKTYASDCSACSDQLVLGYTPGECSTVD